MDQIQARRKIAPIDMVWWDRNNTIEIAAWLAAHGVSGVTATFKHSGAVELSVGGYSREIPDDESGIWIDGRGGILSHEELTKGWDVISSKVEAT